MLPYIKTPKIVYAIQVVFKNCCELIELGEQDPDHLEVLKDSDGIVYRVVVKAGNTYMTANTTDWVIKEDDTYFVISDEDFTATYEEAVEKVKETEEI